MVILYDNFTKYLEKVTERKDLTFDEAVDSFDLITTGNINDIRIGAFLSALKTKGETSTEVAAFVTALRRKANNINPHVRGRLTDTAGTGHALLKTINISTISAIVAAGSGVPIVKHGNRGITSVCGSADLIEALGANISLTPDQVNQVIEKIGFGFLFAPIFHPAFKYALLPRKELRIATVFNILGPLTNPAGAKAQIIGVYSEDLVGLVADSLRKLGTEKALVVYGDGGLDELSTIGKTTVAEINGDKIENYQIEPKDFGLEVARPESIEGKNPAESAVIARNILSGKEGPELDVVLLNAAGAIYVAGASSSIADGIKIASESITSGKALDKLEKFIEMTNEFTYKKD